VEPVSYQLKDNNYFNDKNGLSYWFQLYVNEGTEQRVNVAKILAHEDYDSSTISNDICLLKVGCGHKKYERIKAVFPLAKFVGQTPSGIVLQ